MKKCDNENTLDEGIIEINKIMKEFDAFIDACNHKGLMHINDIMASGFFESYEEVNVFFIWIYDEYYVTDALFVKKMGYYPPERYVD